MSKYPVEGISGVTPADLVWLKDIWKGSMGLSTFG